MTYEQTLHYLYETLPMFTRIGSAAYKKDITNIRLLCEYLDNPQQKLKTIHVAGTNGKGSVSHMLASIFQTAGYKTGLHTSPHLYDFRERIRVNGIMADKSFVIDFVDRIKHIAEEIQPSFFEITVAMAFEYFVQQKTDIAIIEVGLGGRLDSTNIITPELSIITNIGWDHMNLLGDSLPEIAFEKAGIIKENIPVVIGEKKPETCFVFEKIAAEKKSPLYFSHDRFEVEDFELSETSIAVFVHDKEKDEIDPYDCDLPGMYQIKNILTVIQSIQLLPKWKIDKSLVQQGLQRVKQLTGLHGRWEIIHQHPTVVLEVAHNKDGIEQMLAHIKKLSFKKLHLVLGMVKDKDATGVLKLLPADAEYYFTQANMPRALEAASLKQSASAFFLNGNIFDNVNLALTNALANASTEDLIIVCGSIFLVAEVQRISDV